MKVGPERGATPPGMPLPGVSLGAPANRALELRELRCFRSVARTGNFNRAARELKVDPPTDVTIEGWWDQARTLEDE